MRRHPVLRRVLPRLTALADEVARDEPRGAGGILVALSGGPDSTSLLLAAEAWREATGRPVAAAHVDHRLRAESAADAAFCRDLCARLAIPLHERAEDPRPAARRRGRGLEEAARCARWAFLEAVLAAEADLACAATGHHRDDQAETVLMRVLRGTGLDGLRGIAPRQGRVIHPLLAETRASLLAFLADRGQPWRLDRTNAADDGTRNRLRRELLPLARDIFGAGAAAALPRLAELAGADLDLLAAVTRDALATCREDGGALSATRLRALEPALARRVLRAWLAETSGLREDLAAVHVEAVRAWLAGGQSGQQLHLPHGVTVTRVFDRVETAAAPAAAGLPAGPAAEYRVRVAPLPGAPPRPGPPRAGRDGGELVCPAEALAGHLRVRTSAAGDALEPLGLGGRKKLSDLLRERRVPLAQRASILLVVDDEGILWVPGVVQAERTRVLPTTRRAVTIFLQRRFPQSGAGG